MKKQIALISSLLAFSFPIAVLANSTNIDKETNNASMCNIKPEKITEEGDEPIYSYSQLRSIANQITVRVIGDNNYGSGTVIGRQKNSYLVLTNSHLLLGVDPNKVQIKTHDGKSHKAKIIQDSFKNSDYSLDMAVLVFTSSHEYCFTPEGIANFNVDYLREQENPEIISAGYSIHDNEIQISRGLITKTFPAMLKNGYQIGYTGDVIQGMSGGPIISYNGKLVGINSISSNPISNSAFVYADPTQGDLTYAEIQQSRAFNWGIPTLSFLLYVDSEILDQYKLPIPNIEDPIVNVIKAPWLKDLEQKARQFTVKIERSTGGNGSGVIIAAKAKDCCEYTVLTARHVFNTRNNSRKLSYIITTPDGLKHNISDIKFSTAKDIDLAVAKFKSNKKYQTANLANYTLENNQYVLSVGYPRKGLSWYLSLGQVYKPNSGVSNTIDKEEGGYTLVYSNITYGGMSGGPVLDIEGRVVAIHGKAEGKGQGNQLQTEDGLQVNNSLGIPIRTFISGELNVSSQYLESKPPSKSPKDEEAATAISVRVPKTNTKPEQWLSRANEQNRLKRYEEALDASEKAIRLINNRGEGKHLLSDAYYIQAISFEKQGLKSGAISTLEKGLKFTSRNDKPKYFLLLSQLHRQSTEPQELQKSLNWIKEAQKIQEDPKYYYEEGDIYTRLEMKEEANKAFNKAGDHIRASIIQYSNKIAENPNHPDNYLKRGGFYLSIEDYKKAEEDYDNYLSLTKNPDLSLRDSANFYRNLAHIKYRLGKSEEAQSLKEKAQLAQSKAHDLDRAIEAMYRSYEYEGFKQAEEERRSSSMRQLEQLKEWTRNERERYEEEEKKRKRYEEEEKKRIYIDPSTLQRSFPFRLPENLERPFLDKDFRSLPDFSKERPFRFPENLIDNTKLIPYTPTIPEPKFKLPDFNPSNPNTQLTPNTTNKTYCPGGLSAFFNQDCQKP
jgi:tetratricopeptide (TPR) repeat protein